MYKVIILTPFKSSHIGHGGEHRSYQIKWECEQAVNPENVILISLALWNKSFVKTNASTFSLRNKHKLINVIYDFKKCLPAINLRRRLKHLSQLSYDFWQIFIPTYYSRLQFSNPAFIAYYKSIIYALNEPIVSIIEHSGFSDIIKLNNKLGIQTLICPQNIESFDTDGRFDLSQTFSTLSRSGNFIAELSVLRECKERLFISKVETALVSGIGLKSQYYPYRPVGIIAEWLRSIRRKRMSYGDIKYDHALFLMLGSAVHSSTGDGFRWFLEQAFKHGLPRGVRVEVIGFGTEKLEIFCKGVESIRFRGWVSQEELEKLLVSARAALVPQPYGFGALTRLAEFASAGIPVIVSEYATYAIDVPSGITVVKDNWASWYAAMEAVLKCEFLDLTCPVQETLTEQQSALQESLLRLIEN